MNLNTVTVKIRPRSPWESIDMGFVLARRWFLRLWLLWLVSGFPALILLAGLSLFLPGYTFKWILALFWFFKPIYELALLNWISKALFAEKISIKLCFREVQQKLSIKQLSTILLHRFTPFRSFSLPVLLLEGLSGKERANRLKLLKTGYGTVALLTILSFCIELIFTVSLISCLYWLIPAELRWAGFDDSIFLPDNWILLLSYFTSCSIIAPLYVCSGFMMYISRRVELEAWDLEIGFKRIQQRLQRQKNGIITSVAILIMAFSLVLAPSPQTSQATSDLDQKLAEETITEVLRQKEFGESVTKFHWLPKKKNSSERQSSWSLLLAEFFAAIGDFVGKFAPYIAIYGKFILWCGSGLIVAFLLIRYSRMHNWLDRQIISKDKSQSVPDIMFGLNLKPDSLPGDVALSCSQMLANGAKREAISLLYRATLSTLVCDYGLEIRSSFTEKQCYEEIKKNLSLAESAFFNNLTSLWIFIAYGHQCPDTKSCDKLICQWQNLYGVQS